MAGCRFADLYAGSGAVGIEAISRGAAHVWFTEKAPPALAAIRANLKALHIAQGFAIEERGTGALLERLANAAEKGADAPALVYLDPPWEADAEYEKTLHLLGSVRGRAMLASGALVLAEHSSKAPLADPLGHRPPTRSR